MAGPLTQLDNYKNTYILLQDIVQLCSLFVLAMRVYLPRCVSVHAMTHAEKLVLNRDPYHSLCWSGYGRGYVS